MSDTVTINGSAFIATPVTGRGATDLLRTLQSQLSNPSETLNPEQEAFVNSQGLQKNTPMAMAQRLGWINMPPIIRPEDSLKAGDKEIILKRGGIETRYPYSKFVSMPQEDKQTESRQKESQYKDEFVLVIDAGHGGDDSGATYPPQLNDGDARIQVKEEDLTLAIARKVQQKLHGKEGIKVLMTRESDKYPTLSERVEFSDQNGADLFVSIHANSVKNEKASGYQVFSQKPEVYKGLEKFRQRPRIARSTIAQQYINAYLSARISQGNRSTNIPQGNFQVIREPEAPAVLIETGFVSNVEDRAALMTEEHQEAIATQIASALDHFIRGPVRP